MSAKGRPAKMTDVAASAAARVMEPMKPEQISALKAPRSLRKEGRFAWDHAMKSLSPARLISHGDLVTLEIGCKDYQRWRLLEAEIDRRNKDDSVGVFGGELDTTPNGFRQMSQIRILADRAKKDWIKVASLFGLSPLDRSRVADSAQGDFFQFLEKTDDGDRPKKKTEGKAEQVDPTDPLGASPRIH